MVIHYTAMASLTAARATLCNPQTEVSAHYLIGRDGVVEALVPEDLRAWHAGAGRWGNVQDINSRSVGIELDNTGLAPFSAPQMLALERLLPPIMGRWAIPPERVIGHSDCAIGRKIDPGPRFDWRRLALRGLAIWSDAGPQAVDAAAFGAALTRLGYDPDPPADARLAAFRLRFNPGQKGPLASTDMGRALDLAARFPVDRRAAPA